MAQTSAAKGIESGKVHTSDGVLLTETIIKHFLENDVPVPSEKPIREGIGFDDPASWVLPGELSRFGLGVLFLMRGCSTIKHSLENDVPAPSKKPRREGTAFDNAASWVLPGELSRLNLDVLFLEEQYVEVLLFFRPFADRRDGTRLPHTPTLWAS